MHSFENFAFERGLARVTKRVLCEILSEESLEIDSTHVQRFGFLLLRQS